MPSSTPLEGHQKVACPSCGSSDARVIYDDFHAHCFSCGKHFTRKEIMSEGLFETVDGPSETKDRPSRKSKGSPLIRMGDDNGYEGIPERGLTVETCEKYGYFVRHKETPKGLPIKEHIAPYRDQSGRVVAQKVRNVAHKTFSTLGDFSEVQLFGQHLCRNNGKRLLIVEGEIDALSASQMLGSWPVVSVPNGAQGAVKAIKRNIEFVESYETVVIGFDMDDPGQEAAKDVAELLTPGKACIMSIPEKDANAMLVAKKTREFGRAFWDAAIHMPGGIINGSQLWDAFNKPVTMGIPYPWPKLTKMTYGQRKGELVTWTSGSGMGKSAFVAEIAYDLLSRGYCVGYVALEENVGRTAQRMVGIHLSSPIHLPESATTDEAKRAAFSETLGTGRFWTFDHFGSIDDSNIVQKLRHLAKGCQCDFIFLDHISIVVSGMDESNDERRTIDRLMTTLRSMVEETGVGMHLVSHLRRPNQSNKGHEQGAKVSLAQLRGSHSIAQLSDIVIGLERDQQSADLSVRNTTRIRVLKNRYSGETGWAGNVIYNGDTGRLVSADALGVLDRDDAEDDDF